MVKFSCFSPSTRHHKSKLKKGFLSFQKVIQHSGGALQFVPQVTSRDQVMESSIGSASSNPKTHQNNHSALSVQQNASPSSHQDCWKSEDLNSNFRLDDSKMFLQMANLKKSHSLGNMLSNERGFTSDDVTKDDELDQGFSLHYLHHMDINGVEGPLKITSSGELYDQKDPLINSYCQYQGNANPVGSFRHSGEGHDSDDQLFANLVFNSENLSSNVEPTIARSQSMNLRMYSADSIEDPRPHSRSFENSFSMPGGKVDFLDCEGELSHVAASYSHSVPQVFDFNVKGLLPGHADPEEEPIRSSRSSGHNEVGDEDQDGKHWNESRCENQSIDGKHSPCCLDSGEEYQHSSTSTGFNRVTDQERDDTCWIENSECQNQLVDEYVSPYVCQAVDLREPESGGVEFDQNLLQRESLFQFCDELTPEEFNVKRINDWINQIDIQNGIIVEEVGESSSSAPKREPQSILASSSTMKLDSRSIHGMELAYNYISNLNVSSSSAQLSNLGLVAIPILGAFVGLRVLSLSGNSIGTLPKGLRKLNLSKNNISVIEGLKDLTRLRVLDLSYNRISRIGHGLASCSSLKELYLAGNKISEIEGLHRLLKLHIFDLHSNKISTSKGLGQLAANYASLQVIILEGNPAQKNVGDEQLKKYLLSLLPHLVRYNKQSIKANGPREVSDRPRNSSSHQFDRGERSEAKFLRRKHLTAAASSSSNRGLTIGATSSSKQSKSRNARLPPVASKPTNHLPDISRRLLGLEMNNSRHSEG
ncbi:uncharacterized protein [Typha latifolia]|uniref:uncharacterized protein isoform X2 n=1 Tax=Typha latifolia TaxID=4733 RepID=UPI003C2B4EE4